MKNRVKQIIAVAVIATVVTSAQANVFTDTVTGWWNSACAKTTQAKNATANFFASNYFFAKNLLELRSISAKISKREEITPVECSTIKQAISYSALSEQEKRGCYTAFDRAPGILTVPMAGRRAPVEGITLAAANQRLQAIIKEKQNQYIATTAAITAGIVLGYTARRLTARKSIGGFCR